MICFLALFGGLSIHQAAATALYQRRRSIAWRIAGPVCAGALVFGYAGAALRGLAGVLCVVTGGLLLLRSL